MTRAQRLITLGCLALLAQPALAEDVQLPAPVLTWSFYIFLFFAAAVAIGIFFVRTRGGLVNEPLGSLVEAPATPVYSVSKNATVRDCVHKMMNHRIGAILVMENERLIGIFSERDCLLRVVGPGLDPEQTLVRDVMTKDPHCVTPQTSLSEAMNIITNYRFRHLPVIDNGRVLGMVSSGDLMLRLASGSAADVQEVATAAKTRRPS
jgi:CBS domain-containing protein